jgi:hypothetical protein
MPDVIETVTEPTTVSGIEALKWGAWHHLNELLRESGWTRQKGNSENMRITRKMRLWTFVLHNRLADALQQAMAEYLETLR